ncbi:hypothetical protein KI387_037536, partial [Taxus chinensis]
LRRKTKGDDGAGMVVPGQTGFPIIGETFSFFSSLGSPSGVQSFTERRAKRYGRTFLTNILGQNRVFTSEREAVKLVWSSEHRLFTHGGGRAAEEMMGRDSIFYAGSDVHKKMRRLVGEPLSRDILKKNFERMEAICLDILDGWSGKTVSAIDGTSSARKNLMALLDNIIERRRKGEEIKDDFIQSMISRDGLPQEERLTNSEIKDNCLALLLAGHATTGATLTWVMKYLEENPDAKETLMEEYRLIQEKNAGLTWDDISNMPYTSKVF